MNASAAPFTIDIVAFDAARADLHAVRGQVFIDEQGVPPGLERDADDPGCIHVLARDQAGRPVGAGRISPTGRIGRMAVLREWRGRGVGVAMLDALLDQARARSLAEATLHAQASAIDFYSRHGFLAVGERFREAADDLTARVFIRAIERLHQYRPKPGATFRSWLFAIARNMLADDWRRRKDIRLLPDQVDLTHDDYPGPEAVAIHRSEMDRLRAALASLSERQQDVIELRMVGFTSPEIADALGVSVSAVKSAQSRAYRSLKQKLSETKGADS